MSGSGERAFRFIRTNITRTRESLLFALAEALREEYNGGLRLRIYGSRSTTRFFLDL